MNSVNMNAKNAILDDQLKAALFEEVNLPTLLLVLAHITGDDRWVEGEYVPRRSGMQQNDDSAGFSEELQDRIKNEAWDIISAYRNGEFEISEKPSPKRLVKLLSSLLGDEIPDNLGQMFAEELGTENRDVDISANAKVTEAFNVIVIGTGVSGILISMQLAKSGIKHTVIEKNSEIGGTWWENHYPGCGVDTPSHAYSYSFAQRHDWTHYFSKREELQDYLRGIVEEHDLRRFIQFKSEVLECRWDEKSQGWKVEVRGEDGMIKTQHSNVVVSAAGLFNSPSFPEIKGLNDFKGKVLHTAKWNDEINLEGARVGVIGTGASAMQLVPAIADKVEHLTVFQRTPQWVYPQFKYTHKVSEATQILMKEIPFYLGWYRLILLWNAGDRLFNLVRIDPEWPHSDRSINALSDKLRSVLIAHMTNELGDKADEYLPKCLPSYPPYGKRPLMDNGWFRTIVREDVNLVTEGVTEVKTDHVVTASGEHPVDVLVIATGFNILNVLGSMEIYGRDNVRLRDVWGADNAQAYLGMSVPGLPNFFTVLGPNTFPGHGGSLFTTIELEVRYIMEMIQKMMEENISSVECKQEAHDRYNTKLADELQKTVWAHQGMSTYYRNSEGNIIVAMPWKSNEYWHMTREPQLEDYEVQHK